MKHTFFAFGNDQLVDIWWSLEKCISFYQKPDEFDGFFSANMNISFWFFDLVTWRIENSFFAFFALRKWVHKADVDTKKHSQTGWSDEDKLPSMTHGSVTVKMTFQFVFSDFHKPLSLFKRGPSSTLQKGWQLAFRFRL